MMTRVSSTIHLLGRRRRGAASLLAAVVALWCCGALIAYAASLDNIFPTQNANYNCRDSSLYGVACQTDNSTLTVYRETSLSYTGRLNIAGILNRQFQPTDLSVSYPANPVYSGGAETDIIYRQGDLTGTFDGYTWCDDAVGSLTCDQHYVQFESATPTEALSCHESGHAVGLLHGEDAYPAVSNNDGRLGCMRLPAVQANTSLGALNVSEINLYY